MLWKVKVGLPSAPAAAPAAAPREGRVSPGWPCGIPLWPALVSEPLAESQSAPVLGPWDGLSAEPSRATDENLRAQAVPREASLGAPVGVSRALQVSPVERSPVRSPPVSSCHVPGVEQGMACGVAAM